MHVPTSTVQHASLDRQRESNKIANMVEKDLLRGPPSKPLNNVMTNLPDTIFGVMTALAKKHQSVNLGQGFPDDEGPDSMKVGCQRSHAISRYTEPASQLKSSLLRFRLWRPKKSWADGISIQTDVVCQTCERYRAFAAR